MYNILITCRSSTAAAALERRLLKDGCLCIVTQPPRELTERSCAYAVKLSSSCLGHAKKIISDYSIPIGRIFTINNGKYILLEG